MGRLEWGRRGWSWVQRGSSQVVGVGEVRRVMGGWGQRGWSWGLRNLGQVGIREVWGRGGGGGLGKLGLGELGSEGLRSGDWG